MRFLRRARNVRRVLYSPLAILCLAVLLAFLLKAAFGAYRNEQKSREELSNIRANAEELSARETFISTQIERLESERGLEEELRSKFPVAKEGEHVVIIVDPQKDAGEGENASSKGFWSRLLDIFR